VPRSESSSRARGVATIERALQARRPRRRSAAVAGVAAVAAGVLAWVTLERFEPPDVPRSEPVSVLVTPTGEGALLRDSKGEVSLQVITALPGGGRILTERGGGAALQLSTGTRLELGSASDLTLVSQDALQLFALQQGLLDAHIAKLAPGQRFVIDTPDAQIEVRGTVFRLQVLQQAEACAPGARSRLDVREGAVEVRSGARMIRLVAGEHWPPECAKRTDSEAAVQAPAPAPPPASVRARAGGAVSQPAVAAGRARSSKRSSLAEQNDAFRAALAASERADTAAALRAYAQFIRRFPASALAENAWVERLRLLAASDPARARAEAARYLERYPSGFARGEAERILEAP
jgi:hypothetical protein